jgi:hypothetical protein
LRHGFEPNVFIFAQMPLPGNTTSLAIQETGTYHLAARKETPQGTGLPSAFSVVLPVRCISRFTSPENEVL